MIAVFCTSSPIASVALFSNRGELLGAESAAAGRNAGAIILNGLMQLLDRLGRTSQDIEAYVADTGPGSFTGVRVGVILAKSLAYAQGKPCGGLSSFDLISTEATVAIGAKRGSYFVRRPGWAPLSHQSEWPEGAVGYGAEPENSQVPLAERAGPLLAHLVQVSPFELLPEYVAEPNISLPKRPYGPNPGAAKP